LVYDTGGTGQFDKSTTLPGKEKAYPTKLEQENHRLKTCFGKENFVSSQEGISDTFEKYVVPYFVFSDDMKTISEHFQDF